MKAAKATSPIALVLFAAACAGEPAQEAPAASPDAATQVPRIPVDPTASDSLPDAVLGTAPPPMGMSVHYVQGDSVTTGYIAVPEGAGPFPAAILIHEWNGLVDRVRQVADALAAEGYVALAADLYGGRTGSNADENMALVEETLADSAAIIANLDAAARYLRAQPWVAGPIVTMGWCFGGGVALSYGIGGEEHQGTAIFYGRLIEDPARLAALDHEVYGTFAALDDGIPVERVESFVDALREAGVPNDIHVYDHVDHGFWLWVDREPEGRRDAALDAWQRLKAYMQRVTAG